MRQERTIHTATLSVAGLVLAAGLFIGCESKQDQAIDQAKKQAAATGQAQQVVFVDKNGNTTTTVVQPPVPGQSGQQVTTTVTPGVAPPPPGSVSGPTAVGAPTEPPAQSASAAPAQTTPPQPTPGGAPIIRPADVNIPAGSTLVIRINQSINTKTTPPGSSFTGELDEGWTDANGRVVLPRGTPVGGRVVESHNGGHFKGASVLGLRLTSLTFDGTRYPLDTRSVIRERKGKGKRSAGFIGGGSGLGLLIGGLAGGAKGALIGGLAGAGAGTAGAAFSGNHPVDIPAESVVGFHLADDLTLTP